MRRIFALVALLSAGCAAEARAQASAAAPAAPAPPSTTVQGLTVTA